MLDDLKRFMLYGTGLLCAGTCTCTVRAPESTKSHSPVGTSGKGRCLLGQWPTWMNGLVCMHNG